MFGSLAEFTVSGVHGFRALAAGFRGLGEFLGFKVEGFGDRIRALVIRVFAGFLQRLGSACCEAYTRKSLQSKSLNPKP